MASSSSSHGISLALHGIGENSRNGNASEKTRRIWNKPPTAITVPTNNSKSGQSIASGPYNFTDTVKRPTRNPVVERTYLGSMPTQAPARKRRRTNADGGMRNEGPSNRHYPDKVLSAPENPNDVIDLVGEEEEEDLGLRLPSTSASNLADFITPPANHPFDSSEIPIDNETKSKGIAVAFSRAQMLESASLSTSTRPRRNGVPSSSIEWLQESHGRNGGASGEDEADQIASFSDDPPMPPSRLGGKVSHRIDTGERPKPLPPQSDPQLKRTIDLRKKTNMKSKSGTLLRTVPTKNASVVSLAPRSKAKTRDDFLFAIKTLHFQGKTHENVYVKYEPESEMLELCIDKVETRYILKPDNPKVKVSTYKSFTWTTSAPLVAFYHGDNRELSPLFMIFEESSFEWQPQDYNDMITQFKRVGLKDLKVPDGKAYIELNLSYGRKLPYREKANGYRPSNDKQTTGQKPLLERSDEGSSSPDPLALTYPISDDEVHEVPKKRPGPFTKKTPKPRSAKRDVDTENASMVVRRSTRQADNSSIDAHETLSPIENPEELVLVYPWGTPGAVNLNRGDIGRLRPSQFLNDNLIEFGLKLWLTELERTKPEIAQEVHLFSPFFYGKLKVSNGYQNVRRWTSKVDIFKKKYLVVPINENYHWYLAIIYHPEHVLREPPEVQSPSTRARTRRSSPPLEALPAPMAVDGTTEDEALKPDEIEETYPGTRPQSPAETMSGASPDAVETLTRLSQTLDLKERDDSRPTTPTPEKDAMTLSPLTSIPCSPIDLPPRPLELDINSDDDCVMLDGTEVPRTLSPTLSEMGNKLPTATSEDSTNAVVGDDTRPEDHTAYPSKPVEGIPPEQSYGSRRPKRKSNVLDSPGVEILENHNLPKSYSKKDKGKQVERTPKVKEAPRDITFIITFDSLGSKHPKVVSTLAEYLRLEAKDKLNLDKTTKAQGKQALVPVQPNFSDCGLYLIHFTTTFMSNPEHYYNLLMTQQLSLAQKKTEWKETSISSMREQMIAQAERLGEEWRVWKEQKEKEEKEKPRDLEESVADVDSDVDIVDVTIDVPETGKQKGKGRGGGGGKAKKL